MITIRSATIDDIAEVLAFWADATVEPSATDERQDKRLRYVKTFPAKEARDG